MVIPEITRLGPGDIAAAAGILNSAFRSSNSYFATLRRYLVLQPDGWLIARVNGEAAGMVGAINYGTFAYVGLMAVVESRRRQGIARQLMDRLLAQIDSSGCPVVMLDATDAGAALYPSLGFEDDEQIIMYEHSAPQGDVLESVQRLRADDFQALVAFDTPHFGADRSAVLRSYVADFAARTFIVRDSSGQITSYVIAQEHSIGPWMARRAEDAELLLRAALSLPYVEGPRTQIPSLNTAGIDLLRRYGFVQTRVLRHMRRGGSRDPRDRSILYGQTNFALG